MITAISGGVVEIPTVPLTTWEQAGIVVLFVLLVAGLGYGIYQLLLALIRPVSEISKQFQEFIIARDKVWQDYFEAREDDFKERNGEVVNVLRELVREFQAHDEETRLAIAKMEERTRPFVRRPAKKAGE